MNNLSNRSITGLTLTYTIAGLLILVWMSTAKGEPPQAPPGKVWVKEPEQAPKGKIWITSSERRYDIRQNESGKWFAIVAQPGSGEFSADEVWDVIERLNSKPSPPQKRKTCNCSPACTCGCQEGGQCICDQNKTIINNLSVQVRNQQLQVESMLMRQQQQVMSYRPITYQPMYYQPPMSYQQPMSFNRRGGSC